MKYTLIAGLSLLLSSCSTLKPNSTETPLPSEVDDILAQNKFNGVILITQASKTLYSKAIGFSDLEHKTPLKPKNQFVIGSISKQITAVLILREVERGSIKLDDTINKYLPAIRQPWTAVVTIHHLLTHTHGITDLQKPLDFEQGSQFQYSQLGYELLAQILERISNQSFEEISSQLFDAYGLKNTFHPDRKKYRNLVKSYIEQEDGRLAYEANSLNNFVAAGSFISNAQDLNKWNRLLHSGMLVKKETLALMKTRYATRMHPIFDQVEYGYGLLFRKGEENIQIGALGYAPGFVSACYFYPQLDINVIVLENTARDLNNFKNTFKVHIAIMDMIKMQQQ